MIGIFFATIVGFTMGIARLSSNWLIARLATVYVETIRNVPLLLQLFVWYFAVLKTVPSPRQSLELPGGVFLNLRGLYLPAPVPKPGFDCRARGARDRRVRRDRDRGVGASPPAARRARSSRAALRRSG